MGKNAEKFVSFQVNSALGMFVGAATALLAVLIKGVDLWPINELKALIIITSSILIGIVVLLGVFTVYLLQRIKDVEAEIPKYGVQLDSKGADYGKSI